MSMVPGLPKEPNIKDKVENIWKKYKGKYDESSEKQKIQSQIAAGLVLYRAFGQPDTILGIYPIEKCQTIEFTTSQDILKYRAVGAQFLAKQDGAYWAMRIDAVLTPEEAPIYLIWLDYLYTYGGKYEKHELENTNITDLVKDFYKGGTEKKRIASKDEMKKTNKGQIPSDKSMDPDDFREYRDVNDWSFLKNTWHKTFSIVTKDQIYTNCFIESYVYYQDVKNNGGKEVHVTILCRQFFKPPEVISAERIQLKLADKYKAKVTSNEENKGKISKPGEEAKTYLLINKKPADKSHYEQSAYIVTDKIGYDDKGNPVAEDTELERLENIYKIDKNGVLKIDKTTHRDIVVGKGYTLKYGYAESVANIKYQNLIKYKSRMPKDMDSMILAINAARRAARYGALLLNQEFRYSINRIGSEQLISRLTNIYSEREEIRTCFVLGTNNTIIIDESEISNPGKFEFDDFGEIEALKYGLVFNKGDSVYWVVLPTNVTYPLREKTLYLLDNTLFICVGNFVKMWRYMI